MHRAIKVYCEVVQRGCRLQSVQRKRHRIRVVNHDDRLPQAVKTTDERQSVGLHACSLLWRRSTAASSGASSSRCEAVGYGARNARHIFFHRPPATSTILERTLSRFICPHRRRSVTCCSHSRLHRHHKEVTKVGGTPGHEVPYLCKSTSQRFRIPGDEDDSDDEDTVPSSWDHAASYACLHSPR